MVTQFRRLAALAAAVCTLVLCMAFARNAAAFNDIDGQPGMFELVLGDTPTMLCVSTNNFGSALQLQACDTSNDRQHWNLGELFAPYQPVSNFVVNGPTGYMSFDSGGLMSVVGSANAVALQVAYGTINDAHGHCMLAPSPASAGALIPWGSCNQSNDVTWVPINFAIAIQSTFQTYPDGAPLQCAGTDPADPETPELWDQEALTNVSFFMFLLNSDGTFRVSMPHNVAAGVLNSDVDSMFSQSTGSAQQSWWLHRQNSMSTIMNSRSGQCIAFALQNHPISLSSTCKGELTSEYLTIWASDYDANN